MTPIQLEGILPFVEKPSRYLGTETNSIHKELSHVRLRFALAFPDLYEIGMSHFGLQILYHILNREDDIAAERVFTPAEDMTARLKSEGLPLFSLESRLPVGEFDMVGFSLLYELNYTNVLTMLDLAGIPRRAADRRRRHPLVIAGGTCTCNPEPVAPFFDAFVIGDGEENILEMCRVWMEWQNSGSEDKDGLLDQWSRLEGIYIPAHYRVTFDGSGAQHAVPVRPDRPPAVRSIVTDLDAATFPTRPIVPYGRPVHDRLRLEISRGCSRGCRFCQAGMIYRPVRERSPQTLMSLARESLAGTGFEDMSLLSLSSGDYGCIAPLLEGLMARHAGERVAISLPSLRAGTLTPELMSLIKRVRKTGFTIAPEAGSQRLRDVINKNISEAEIFAAVENAFELGWRVIKLYFMIGLPTETDADLEAIVDLVKRLRKSKGRKGQINVSVATFIPKSHTPFQWAPQISLDESDTKIRWLRRQLKLPGIKFKWQNPEVSLIEGVFARGDRRLASLLEAAHARGCRFDGWSDRFELARWQQAFDLAGTDPSFYTTRVRDLCEPLPWDHLDLRVSKDYLRDEWHRALCTETSVDCRNGDCLQCGSCDFQRVEPRTYADRHLDATPEKGSSHYRPPRYRKMHLRYSKTGPARYFGHLELKNIIIRAFRRAGMPLRYSEGFHPQPKVSFQDALPIGLESESEDLVLQVETTVDTALMVDRLNDQLPAGIEIIDCRPMTTKASRPQPAATVRYAVTLPDGKFEPAELEAFMSLPSPTITIGRPKGRLKKIEIKDILVEFRLSDDNQLHLTLASVPGKTLRPADLIAFVFSLPEEQLKQARIVKKHA
jgi:radical SAM family uncharacterized protein/radical SAM-linked protein